MISIIKFFFNECFNLLKNVNIVWNDSIINDIINYYYENFLMMFVE